MPNFLNSITSLAPFHLLAYSSLLGAELYQTFIMTGLSYRAIPLPQFRSLQKSVFPAYFNLQLLLIAAVAVTHPPHSLVSLANRWGELVPVVIMFMTSSLNWGVWGPRTLQAMIEQTHQETRDGRRYGDPIKSDEMKAVMRQFSKAHAMSIHLNLVTIIATLWYGFVLASKFSYAKTPSQKN